MKINIKSSLHIHGCSTHIYRWSPHLRDMIIPGFLFPWRSWNQCPWDIEGGHVTFPWLLWAKCAPINFLFYIVLLEWIFCSNEFLQYLLCCNSSFNRYINGISRYIHRWLISSCSVVPTSVNLKYLLSSKELVPVQWWKDMKEKQTSSLFFFQLMSLGWI